MDIIISFITCIVLILIFGKIFLFPVKKIAKVILNTFLGAFTIWLINLIGTSFGFHIGLNIISSVIVGLLGVPGAILLILLKLFCNIG